MNGSLFLTAGVPQGFRFPIIEDAPSNVWVEYRVMRKEHAPHFELERIGGALEEYAPMDNTTWVVPGDLWNKIYRRTRNSSQRVDSRPNVQKIREPFWCNNRRIMYVKLVSRYNGSGQESDIALSKNSPKCEVCQENKSMVTIGQGEWDCRPALGFKSVRDERRMASVRAARGPFGVLPIDEGGWVNDGNNQ